ncbi:5' nucleotidase, NT5C type [Mycobacteroides chelonae]|uniref:5' nucleotidase, NT5C type n=1 Tax=Mycobacteroides chelonae TaxID=1774 RepID=UPI00096A9A21|nr:hypothetical protein [Mycobacteroides chelonae]
MARVGVDLDGVLYDFGDAFRDYLVSRHNWDITRCQAPRRWEFYEDWGISSKGFVDICNAAADARALWCVKPLLGAYPTWEALRKLKRAGHSVHVITNRNFGTHPAVSHEETAKWLRVHDVLYDTLTFSADKTVIETEYFIEDNADNYLALEKAGCRSVLINRPWNHHVESAWRVDSVACFVDLVLGETA